MKQTTLEYLHKKAKFKCAASCNKPLTKLVKSGIHDVYLVVEVKSN